MNKIRKLLKTHKDCKKFSDLLILQIKENKPISENSMIDGMVIGFIFSNDLVFEELILDKLEGRLLDSTIQKIENIVIWIVNNEDYLCELIKNKLIK